ncbi:MAG: Uma2 family endonuclease [Desmonostoc vinosum HA7617-LM4]|jgi:Uma2 family endonuclease|nr:Uma2 family endonuclease [Desmonostoc vinosum HA7617-LM4]
MSEPATLEITSCDNLDTEIIFPPGDLFSDEPPLESDFHRDQIELLIRTLKLWWREKQDFYASGNLTIYYSPNQKKSADFRGPDFFVVLGTQKKDRKSWVVWQEEGKYPHIIVEILSRTTAAIDRGLKKQIYQDTFRTPDYFWFDPVTLEFRGFHLVDGKYQEIQPTSAGQLWSQQLELYLGVHENKLRFFTVENQLIPSPEEIATQEQLRAQQAEERAQQAEERAQQAEGRTQQAEQEIIRLREMLHAQGINPENS